MTALDQLADWPVSNCAAAVVGLSGTLATFGDQRHRFQLASVTKPLAALAVLVAVEEEAVGLDQPLTDLPVAAQLPGATLRHLLAHASGIAPDRRERAASPGTRRIYSNAGFDVIGELVSAATSMPFADYLREAVATPLRLNDTSLDGSPAKDGVGTVADLAKVLAELLIPSGLLHSSTSQAATSVQFPNLRGVLPGYGVQEHNDWGLGFEIRADKSPHWTSEQNSPASYGHFGRSGTMFWVDPHAQLALVALADRDFDEWAVAAWPRLSTAVLDEFG
jgi:CubicO group peptidase (beta-lactamase class C family)